VIVPGPASARRHFLRPAIAAVVLTLTLAACSTSGRELKATSITIPPQVSTSGASSSSPSRTGSLIEGLGGFAMTSPEFAAGGSLPRAIGRDVGNRSPALQWTSTPESAAELALVASDATGRNVYWLVTAMPATDVIVAPGVVPLDGSVQPNTAGRAAWDGPVADQGTSVPVVFRLYALDEPFTATPGLQASQTVEQIASASFASATLTANYLGDQPQLN
jgi:phosphatidylethanolamine-binding protein (PEBP) family uncharacterized protein